MTVAWKSSRSRRGETVVGHSVAWRDGQWAALSPYRLIVGSLAPEAGENWALHETSISKNRSRLRFRKEFQVVFSHFKSCAVEHKTPIAMESNLRSGNSSRPFTIHHENHKPSVDASDIHLLFM